jgi:hypothetical protein
MTDRTAWLIVAVALVLSIALLLLGRGKTATIGDSIPILITVIPEDSSKLDCASDMNFDTARCNYDQKRGLQSAQNPLRPYITDRRELWVLTGVFEDPRVGRWHRRAVRTGNNARVTISCQAEILGTAKSIALRWQTDADWDIKREVPIARVRDCRVVQ